jgi:hypothetical protein
LSVTKKEWNGMVVLLILIALILAASYAYQLPRKDSTINAKDFNAALAVPDKAKKSQPCDYPANTPTLYKKAAPGTVTGLNAADSAALTTLV